MTRLPEAAPARPGGQVCRCIHSSFASSSSRRDGGFLNWVEDAFRRWVFPYWRV
jgi:hypothetical protein